MSKEEQSDSGSINQLGVNNVTQSGLSGIELNLSLGSDTSQVIWLPLTHSDFQSSVQVRVSPTRSQFPAVEGTRILFQKYTSPRLWKIPILNHFLPLELIFKTRTTKAQDFANHFINCLICSTHSVTCMWASLWEEMHIPPSQSCSPKPLCGNPLPLSW